MKQIKDKTLSLYETSCFVCFVKKWSVLYSIICSDLRFQCMACGPGDKGRCYGPNICCGEGLGCMIGSPATARCLQEEYLLSPCESGGKPCGPDEGRCAAPGVCCYSDGCMLDSDCMEESEQEDVAERNSFLGGSRGELLLHILHPGRARSPY
ncbi:hypothetical protein QTP70_032397 [Hemibagrus guttatus]|uniref:Isotocin n=1 Tax=Hemibagrus guttatus TaxID=175788 RepID=A0AAE0PWD4_9TELE|nr:hypothetical protein QTP70_032397 [Hemibagrus guttatus]